MFRWLKSGNCKGNILWLNTKLSCNCGGAGYINNVMCAKQFCGNGNFAVGENDIKG